MLTRSQARQQSQLKMELCYPLRKYSATHFGEGFWNSKFLDDDHSNGSGSDSEEGTPLPFPQATHKKVSKTFLDKLEQIIQSKTQESTFVTQYKGFSFCRLCKCRNGSCEYNFQHPTTGISFTIPSGLVHYYKDHNVQPSTEFQAYIASFPLLESNVNSMTKPTITVRKSKHRKISVVAERQDL